jgi:ribosome recycling factor
MNKQDLDNAIQHLKDELIKVKTGRANPEMIENIMVNAYGTKMPLKELANISVPEPRQFLVSPYDAKSNIKAIESALNQANLGSSPQTQEDNIRLSLPDLTEETRKREVAEVHKKAEETKIRIRDIRHKELDAIKSGDSSEEEKDYAKKTAEDTVKEYNDKVDQIAKAKEEEVMKI